MVQELFATAGSAARVVRTLLVFDVVESVRLTEQDEEHYVGAWRALLDRISTQVLPTHGGRVLKSLGDGLLVEFPRVGAAVQAAFEIQRLAREAATAEPRERQIWLRAGVHIAELLADERDLYGHGINLAARLTTLARPGEVVTSAEVRDLLTPPLDAEVEDLGDCYLKHLSAPVRAYRLTPPGEALQVEPAPRGNTALLPTIAVIPFWSRSGDPQHELIGEVLADEVIAALSRAAQMNVISRLSTTAFRGRAATLDEIGRALRAQFVLSGSYQVSGRKLVLLAQLTDARSGCVLWSGDLKGSVAQLLNGSDEMLDALLAAVGRRVLDTEVLRAQHMQLATLENHALLLGGIALMHRLSRPQFDRARELLGALVERTPRQAVPLAWLGKWHVLRVQQGWTDDATAESRAALDATQRALDLDPGCSLALAIDGFVHTNLLKRLDLGLDRYDRALGINPNESLAWLLRGTLHAFRGEGEAAVVETGRALALSPLDPLRYFYDSLSATAALSAGQYEYARGLAERSLRANRTHTSTLRSLIVAQWMTGRESEARQTVEALLQIDQGFTVSGFRRRSPAGASSLGSLAAEVFAKAGVPA
jgi:class 3 adenylate cyclase/TolB-like protein